MAAFNSGSRTGPGAPTVRKRRCAPFIYTAYQDEERERQDFCESYVSLRANARNT